MSQNSVICMAKYSSLSKAMKGVDNAVALGVKRALNRSVKTTRTLVTRQLRKEMGLKSDQVKSRLIANQVKKGVNNPYAFKASIGIAMKRLFPLRLFKPKAKKIKTIRGMRTGVTVKVGADARELVPGAFIMTLKNGTEIVASRKTDKRKPTRENYTTKWQDVVRHNLKDYKSEFLKEFKRIVQGQIDYAISKRANASKSEE